MADAEISDTKIVRAAIHPGIGIARIGDAEEAYFIGPEVTTPAPLPPGGYRDDSEALKRQAARFRIYGYNAKGEVVAELTPDEAEIRWTVELANTKGQWYRFITAMDIPETADLSVPRRNPAVIGAAREALAIRPGKRCIGGKDAGGCAEHAFDTGSFTAGGKTETGIYLGELRTDDAGRLMVLGGRGVSKSTIGAPPFDANDSGSFNNADTWYDDTSDGPVSASVILDGEALEVTPAWVVVAPPNYAPDVIGWRTMYDLLIDVYTANGWLDEPFKPSFTQDILPQLSRLSNLQWVNKGFAAMFGKGAPMDFKDKAFLARLASLPSGEPDDDPWEELRHQIFNAFRPPENKLNEPRIWPWIYGDDFGGPLFSKSPRTMLALPSLQAFNLRRWAKGWFVADYDPEADLPRDLQDLPMALQPEMLDQAALHFCLADAFHPGCELTWPMRHATLFSAPFRIRHADPERPLPDYGANLTSATALGPGGPLYGQRAGDLTRWMGLPWQGDTAYCRSGYDPAYDPYLPTFWPARVPNQVLTAEDYAIVVNENRPREERLAAYQRRASWYRFIDDTPGVPPDQLVAKRMERMIAIFGAQGIVEARPGLEDDPDIPETLYVETLPATHGQKTLLLAQDARKSLRMSEDPQLERAGWGTQEHLDAAIAMRKR